MKGDEKKGAGSKHICKVLFIREGLNELLEWNLKPIQTFCYLVYRVTANSPLCTLQCKDSFH